VKISEGYRPERRVSFGEVMLGIVGWGIGIAGALCVGVYWLKATGIIR
jgi:hypothetical protein